MELGETPPNTLRLPVAAGAYWRDGALSPDYLVEACVEARIGLRGNDASVVALVFRNGLRFVVKSQSVHIVRRVTWALRMRPTLLIEQRLVRVGGSSFDFAYRISCELADAAAPELIAEAHVRLVCVKDRKAHPLPQLPQHMLPPPSPPGGLGDQLEDAISRSAPPAPGGFVYRTTVRFSDEDINMHTNHASYFRFFLDAYHSLMRSRGLRDHAATPSQMGVEYVRETFVSQELEIAVVSSIQKDAHEDFVMFLYAPGRVLSSRCWIRIPLGGRTSGL